MTESCKQLLSRVYDSQKTSTRPLCIELDSVSLYYDAEYLTQNGYVTQPSQGAGALILSITEKGKQFVENGFSTPSPASGFNSFHFNGNATFTNSIVGSGISGNQFTFHNSPQLAELETLIQSKPTDDQKVLNEMLEILREIQNSEKPIEKGRLSRFYEVVKKSSDLVLPISKFLFDIFFRLGA